MNASFGITHADPLAHVVDWADLPAAQQPTWPDAEQARTTVLHWAGSSVA